MGSVRGVSPGRKHLHLAAERGVKLEMGIKARAPPPDVPPADAVGTEVRERGRLRTLTCDASVPS
jgi:hypothetical protein